MSRQFIIFSLEPLETRYTKEWITHLPKVFQQKLGDDFDVFQINGSTKSKGCTPGGFLDFAATNMWKCEQITEFFNLFSKGHIEDDAIILFTDAWHPGVLNVKYTKDLLKKSWTLISFWHAGSYIDEDPLGQLIEDKSWSYGAEESFYNACDINVFATAAHFEQFYHRFPNVKESKALRSGFPMEYIYELKSLNPVKRDLVVFAARNSPEKHPELFDALKHVLPDYEFINCQEEGMSKEQYHETLALAKVVVSFAELETLGIVQAEALHFGAIPFCPDWRCYPEEYPTGTPFLFSHTNITHGLQWEVIDGIEEFLTNFELYKDDIYEAREFQKKNFFSCDILIDKIKSLCYHDSIEKRQNKEEIEMSHVKQIREILNGFGVGTGTAYNDKRSYGRRIKIRVDRLLSGKEKYKLMKAIGAFHVEKTFVVPGTRYAGYLGLDIHIKEGA